MVKQPLDTVRVTAFRLLIVAYLFFNCPVSAQHWMPLGPFSQPAVAVPDDRSLSQANGVGRAGAVLFPSRTDPDELLLLTPFDRYRASSDGGENWKRPASVGLPAAGIADIVFMGCGKVFAATGDADCILNPNGPALNSEYCQSRGVYFSDDHGKQWRGPIGTWFDTANRPVADFWKYPSLKVCRKLVCVGRNRKVLLAAIHTCNPLRKQFDGTVYRSGDGGRNWFPVLSVADGFFKDLAIAPRNSKTVYAAGRTVYRSVDAGKTWQSLQATGLPPDSLVSRCELAVTPAAADRLLILVTLRNGKGNELYEYDAFKGRSDKRSSGTASPEWRTALAVDQSDPDLVYFTAGNKVNRFLRTDSVWRPVYAGAGLHDDVHELTSSPSGGSMFASTDGGPALTTDQGKTWKLMYDGLAIAQCWGVAIRAGQGMITLMAGLQDCGTIKSSFPETFLDSAPQETNSIGPIPSWEIVRGGDGMKPLITGLSGKTYITTDGNNNLNYRWDESIGKWRMMNLPAGRPAEYQRPFVADPLDSATYYTGYDDVFRSRDGGNSWQPLGLPPTGITDRRISAIAVAATDPRVLYVAFSQPSWKETVTGKIFRTRDGGASWVDISPGLRGAAWNSITSIAVDPENADHLVVGFRGGWSVKAMESDAGGTPGTWMDISTGLPVSGDVNALVFGRSGSGRLFAATHEGIWSKSGEEDWKDFNGTMPAVFTSDVAIDPSGTFLVSGTHGAGVWLTDLRTEPR